MEPPSERSQKRALNRAAIIGCGAIKPGRYPDRPESELAMEVISLALRDAHMSKEQIEGVFTTPSLIDTAGLQTSLLCEYMPDCAQVYG
ncbi:hypothetical protein ACFLV4_07020 [Chloroflexota bacterium]